MYALLKWWLLILNMTKLSTLRHVCTSDPRALKTHSVSDIFFSALGYV